MREERSAAGRPRAPPLAAADDGAARHPPTRGWAAPEIWLRREGARGAGRDPLCLY